MFKNVSFFFALHLGFFVAELFRFDFHFVISNWLIYQVFNWRCVYIGLILLRLFQLGFKTFDPVKNMTAFFNKINWFSLCKTAYYKMRISIPNNSIQLISTSNWNNSISGGTHAGQCTGTALTNCYVPGVQNQFAMPEWYAIMHFTLIVLLLFSTFCSLFHSVLSPFFSLLDWSVAPLLRNGFCSGLLRWLEFVRAFLWWSFTVFLADFVLEGARSWTV